MSHFAFLQSEWPALHDAATKAEALAYPDARTACFHARRGLEGFSAVFGGMESEFA